MKIPVLFFACFVRPSCFAASFGIGKSRNFKKSPKNIHMGVFAVVDPTDDTVSAVDVGTIRAVLGLTAEILPYHYQKYLKGTIPKLFSMLVLQFHALNTYPNLTSSISSTTNTQSWSTVYDSATEILISNNWAAMQCILILEAETDAVKALDALFDPLHASSHLEWYQSLGTFALTPIDLDLRAVFLECLRQRKKVTAHKRSFYNIVKDTSNASSVCRE